MIQKSTTAETADLAARDLALVKQVLAGEPACVDRLVERLQCVPAMIRARNRRWGQALRPDEVEDLIQDCLVVLWKKLGTFAGLSPLEHWAHRICSLEMMNALRARDRHSAAGTEVVESVPEPCQEELVATDRHRVGEGLQQLGPPAEDIIRLKHFEHLTFDEIARRTGTAVNTAKSHYYRGLRRLRQVLQGLAPEEAA